jgi:hypothetical protein
MIEITLPQTFFRFLDSWFAVSSTCTCGAEPTPPPCWRRHPWPLSYPGSPAPPAQYTHHTWQAAAGAKRNMTDLETNRRKTKNTAIDAGYGFDLEKLYIPDDPIPQNPDRVPTGEPA